MFNSGASYLGLLLHLLRKQNFLLGLIWYVFYLYAKNDKILGIVDSMQQAHVSSSHKPNIVG